MTRLRGLATAAVDAAGTFWAVHRALHAAVLVALGSLSGYTLVRESSSASWPRQLVLGATVLIAVGGLVALYRARRRAVAE